MEESHEVEHRESRRLFEFLTILVTRAQSCNQKQAFTRCVIFAISQRSLICSTARCRLVRSGNL